MFLEGTVIDGQIILDEASRLPEGTRIRIELAPPPSSKPAIAEKPTLQWLLDLAGTADDLPEDMALNHDHYLHGAPRR